jgi:UDP-GlcNAc:undecaprenyl-phosphate GlcNAc-1-phosphate transferase
MRPVLLAFAVSAALTVAFVRLPRLSRRLTRPAAAPRWRSDPVPLAGGLAMAAGFGVAVAAFGRGESGAGGVLAAAGVALATGLADDLRPLPALAKLAGQAAAGIVLVAAGVHLALPGPGVVAWVATVVWVVVAANAVNLFDNIDGAAGGMGLVAAAALWIWWATGSGPSSLAAGLAGAVAGFLVLNLHPARIFMGDAGSHFLGAALAGLTILDAGRAGSPGPAPAALVLGVPLVLLAAPLFDTALVAVERLRHGRPISTGGRDHTSHRLVVLGLGVPLVAAGLWALSVVAAGVASLAVLGGWWFPVGSALLAVSLAAFGARLARVRVYG